MQSRDAGKVPRRYHATGALVSAAIGADSRDETEKVLDRPQLTLTVEVAGDGASALAALAAALDAAEFASVQFAPAPGVALDARTLKPLIERAQAKGAAALVNDDVAVARIVMADGLHVAWNKDVVARFRQAREDLGARFIVGADAGRSRHDAMELGEAGADYLAFGIPRHVEDRATASVRQQDLVAWWSAIFELPCLALDVASVEQAQTLAIAGADFIAVTLPDGTDAAGAARISRAFAAAVADCAALSSGT